LEQYQADLNVTAYAAELEIAPPGGRPVWEGPCRVEGTWGGAPVRGFAFAELTGYARRPFKF
jgi:hypothetical protein